MKLKFLCFFLIIALPFTALAQTGSLRGVIVDGKSGEPVIQAHVQLMLASGDVAGQAITDFDGIFVIENASPGDYTLKIQGMGYETMEDIPVQIVSGTRVDFGKMKMHGVIELDQVTVTGERPDALIGLDRKVFNVSADINSAGGQAVDVLQNIPSLTVDIDGAVSLRGSENVTIWIDGRPSTLLGMDDQTALQQIPANSIERIEVITNPSARYDPDGTAGIINIVTKKEKRGGWNGNVSAGMGTGDKYDASLYLSHRVGDWTFFGSYGFRSNRRTSMGTDSRDNYLPDTTFSIFNSEEGWRHRLGHNARLGVDWQMTPKDVLSLSGSINNRSGDSPELAEYTNFNKGNLINASDRYVYEFDRRKSQDVALHYEHNTGVKNEKWIADMAFSRSDDSEDQTLDWIYTQYQGGTSPLPESYQDFREAEIETMYMASLDYERELGSWGRLEAGWKSIFDQSDETRDAYIRTDDEAPWEFDSLRSNVFSFEQQIHAVYGNLGWLMGNRWKAQLGVRLEQALAKGDAGKPFENNYFSVFPSGFLTYKLQPNQELQISYTQRINRPSEWSLNPIINYEDPLNLRSGNPNLRPEYIHSSELSYIWYFKGGSLTSAVYYQYATDIFTRYRSILPDGTTLTTFENLNERIRMGAEATAMGKFTPWLSGQANLNLFQSYIQAENLQEDLNQSGFSWFGRLSANIQLPWKLKSQVSYNHRGAGPTGQGYMKAMTSMDLAIARDFLNDRLNISVRLSDIFNTRQFEYSIESAAFDQEMLRKRESRVLSVSLTYRFGTDNKKARDQGRMPGGGEEMMEEM